MPLFKRSSNLAKSHIRSDTRIHACNPPEIDNDGYLDANNKNKIFLYNEGIYSKEKNVMFYSLSLSLFLR